MSKSIIFIEAVRKGHLDTVKMYCNTFGLEYCDRLLNGQSSIVTAAQSGHLTILKYIHEKGGNIRILFDAPIQWSSFYGHLSIVQYLHKAGADIQSGDNLPIKLASQNNHFEVVKYLYEEGANISVVSERSKKYIYFCQKMQHKRKERAQKKIYFWWIPLCYDLNRDTGKRMMQKNLEKAKELGLEF